MFLSINNNQPSFQGAYIIKGVAQDVKKAKELIYKRCGDDVNKLFHPERHYANGFEECNYTFLTPIFDDAQPNVKAFIGTNEHSVNATNWYQKHLKPKKSLFARPMGVPRRNMSRMELMAMIEETTKIINELQEKIAPFKRAQEALEHNDRDPMNDFLIDSYLQAKQRLAEIKEAATVAMDEIKELDALEVIKAIKERRFNFITGEIINK